MRDADSADCGPVVASLILAVTTIITGGCQPSPRSPHSVPSAAADFADQVRAVREGRTDRIESALPTTAADWESLRGLAGLRVLVLERGVAGDTEAEILATLPDIERLALIENGSAAAAGLVHHGWDEIHFAWAGALEPGKGHSYWIEGPSFVVEFVNVQPDAEGNPANHIHCVWRDKTGNFQ